MDPSYNNSLGSAGAMQQPIASGTGDIVLPQEKGGGAKKWWIVGVIIGVFVLLGAAAWLIFGGVFGSGSLASLKNSFNKFANYVISGVEDSGDILVKYDSSEGYYFLTHQTTSDEQAELYNNTTVLLNDFLKNYHAYNGGAGGGLLDTVLDNESQLMNFISVVYTKQLPTRSYIEGIYIELGSAAALQELLQYYDFSQINENSYAEDFSTTYETWANAQIANLDIYRDNDCLVDGAASLYCIRQKSNVELNEALETSNDAIKESRAALGDYFGFSGSFVANVFVINDLLNGTSNDSNVMTGGGSE